MNCSVRIDREIGELACAVTADAAAPEAMQAENDVLVVKVPASIGAEASAFFREVVGSRRGGGADRADSRFDAGEDAVLETGRHAEDLVVPKAGIKGDL